MAQLNLSDHDLLLVVDVQGDFCTGGALEVKGGEQVVPVVNRLMALFEHVVLTQDWHPPGHSSFASSHPGTEPYELIQAPYGEQVLWPDHCVQGTEGAAFHPDLDTTRAQLVIRKGFRPGIDSYSAFFENDRSTATGLAGALSERGFRRLYLVGLATDFCVFFSAADARAQGFEVALIEDACRGIDLDGSLDRAWREMEQAGILRLRSGDLEPAGQAS